MSNLWKIVPNNTRCNMLPSQYVKQGWCQHFMAKDRKGTNINPEHVNAETWCVVGALKVSLFNHQITEEQYVQLKNEIQSQIDSKNITDWNDMPGQKQSEIVYVLTEAENSLNLTNHPEKELVLV